MKPAGIVTVLGVLAAGLMPANAQDRKPRYAAEGTDFVIENGKSFFNRPLYGGNTGFRIEAGDRPEYAFHFPGRAGNVRIGLLAEGGGKGIWGLGAKAVVARHRRPRG